MQKSVFQIAGGRPLNGTVRIGGAKNSALPIMAVSILADDVRLCRVPRLRDVDTLRQVLRGVGVWSQFEDHQTLRVRTIDDRKNRAGYRYVGRMRASFCVLGPLLARRGRAVVALPGGCNLGDRPVGLHLKGLETLGARIHVERGNVIAKCHQLRGADVTVAGPRGSSVTATVNVLAAASVARGRTVIRGAAREPEIADVGNFLASLGAQISGLGTSTIEVAGVDGLGQRLEESPSGYQIIPDRIDAATLMIATAMCGGQVVIQGCDTGHLKSVIEILVDSGVAVRESVGAVRIQSWRTVRPFDMVASPYPGVPTDVQPLLTALATCARGHSMIRDEVFPERWLYLAELERLGARIERLGATTYIGGDRRRLRGATVVARDLRGGAALVLAGLAARGRTVVRGIHHIDRGYESFEDKLVSLGARIQRIRTKRRASDGLSPQLSNSQARTASR